MAEIERILVIGAGGQIGSELTVALRARFGTDNVVASDIKDVPPPTLQDGPYSQLNILDRPAIEKIVDERRIDAIIDLAALLSATGEKNPQACWHINVGGLVNCLEIARERNLKRVLCPSSIAAFGPETPHVNTPQDTILRPRTMYGVTKVTGELLIEYYNRRFGVDGRGLRYPGIISAETLPGGGTTDYAVEIFYKAVETGKYECFLRDDTMLPMMYMPDCIKATIDLFTAPAEKLTRHGDYNVAAFSFTPAELVAEMRKHLPELQVTYEPDFRQAIADSWPASLDDQAARRDWDWRPKYDLAAMTKDMIERLRARHAGGRLYAAAH